jgi:hypothetical protein
VRVVPVEDAGEGVDLMLAFSEDVMFARVTDHHGLFVEEVQGVWTSVIP